MSSNGSKDCSGRDMDTEMKQENQDDGSQVTVSCPVLRRSVIQFLTIDQKWQVDVVDHKEIKTEGGDQKIKKVRLFIPLSVHVVMLDIRKNRWILRLK
jgi:hypothetical protein